MTGRAVEKFNIFHVPAERLSPVLEAASATGPVSIANSFAQNMEITAAGVNKGAALKALCDQSGDGGGAGDGLWRRGQRSGMLSWAGWSFAMANGTGEAKSAARYEAPANTDAGVGQMVERYVLDC